MCYSGECSYENAYGDCTLSMEPGQEIPVDAGCVQEGPETEYKDKVEDYK